MSRLTHFDAKGNAAMVDVTDKATTEREAVAKGSVLMQPETIALIAAGDVKKGDVLSVARLMGQAIKSIHEETSVSSLFV